MKNLFAHILLAGAVALTANFCVRAADDDDKPAPKPTEPVKPDNTKVNERDKPADRLTADQQAQNKNDVNTTAQIRKSIMEDKTLSTNAHNVKIITINGVVTLRGPVKNDTEKMAIEKRAVVVAGENNVKSEIEIAP